MSKSKHKKSSTFFDFNLCPSFQRKHTDSTEVNNVYGINIPPVLSGFPYIRIFRFWGSIVPDPSNVPSNNIQKIINDICTPDANPEVRRSVIEKNDEKESVLSPELVFDKKEEIVRNSSKESKPSYFFSFKHVIDFIKTNVPFMNSSSEDDELSFKSSIKEYYKNSNSLYCKNINPELANKCNIKSYNRNIHNISWEAPSFYGLKNSNRIIPEYYFTNHDYNHVFEIDYYDMILDDIKNLRELNTYQMTYINQLDDERKMKIIETFHDIFNSYASCIKSRSPSPISSDKSYDNEYINPNVLLELSKNESVLYR